MKNAKKNFVLSSFLILLCSFHFSAFAKIESILGDIPLDQNPNLSFKIPETSNPEIVISRPQYIISYNKLRRSPNWVAWKLEADQIGSSGRSNKFTMDQDLESYLSQSGDNLHAVTDVEYKGSCYDRGHQVPSADRTDSQENNRTTFYMSNMIPQTPYLNRVIWEHLEQYSRDLVQKQGKKLYIIAGPIYDIDYGSIGPSKDIPVPSKDFKIIFVLNADQGLADINQNTQTISVIMPNTLQDGSSPLDNAKDLCKPLNAAAADRSDWEQYKTSVDEIESISGYKFFH
ncbi:MAG: DNA/RNA non-specific endonuclease [Bacteriovorax sp.]